MGIDDATPAPTAYEQVEEPITGRRVPPSWADESTVAVPLSELFADDPDE